MDKEHKVSLSWMDYWTFVMVLITLLWIGGEIHKFRMAYQIVHRVPVEVGEH